MPLATRKRTSMSISQAMPTTSRGPSTEPRPPWTTPHEAVSTPTTSRGPSTEPRPPWTAPNEAVSTPTTSRWPSMEPRPPWTAPHEAVSSPTRHPWTWTPLTRQCRCRQRPAGRAWSPAHHGLPLTRQCRRCRQRPAAFRACGTLCPG